MEGGFFSVTFRLVTRIQVLKVIMGLIGQVLKTEHLRFMINDKNFEDQTNGSG